MIESKKQFEFTISFSNLIIWADNQTCFKAKETKKKFLPDPNTSYEMYKKSFKLNESILKEKSIDSQRDSFILTGNSLGKNQPKIELKKIKNILEESRQSMTNLDNFQVPILKSLNGVIKPKSMTTIIGPSGSGKTTLMNFLASRSSWPSNIYIDGQQHLNGTKMRSLSKYKHLLGFVPQNDVLYETSTVRENLTIYATLRGIKNVERKVNEVIKSLSLEKCADTIIGGSLSRGISGGERKRTCIGIELLGDPKILFLDEPTTGIDAHMALEVMKCLKKLNLEMEMTIVSVLHQPRQEIIDLFDQVNVLVF